MRPTARAPRPDPNPMRLLVAMGGVASASALLTALLPSVAPVAADTTGATAGGGTTVTAAQPEPSVVHVKRYVVLAPGQTAPPKSSVVVQPTPTPRVRVVTTTRQSGTP